MGGKGPIAADLCVIGGGVAGFTVAAGAAQLGAATVLVERGAMGGLLLEGGTLAARALTAAARRAALARDGAAFGLRLGEVGVDYAAVLAEARAVARALAPQWSVERALGLGVRVIDGSARFVGPGRVAAGGYEIAARRVVIATGAKPAVPEIAGLGAAPFLTPETIFALDAAPRRLVVIGGGPSGIELAQAHALLGVPVTLVEQGRILQGHDGELVALLRERLIAAGLDLVEGTRVTSVERTGGGIALTVEAAGETRRIDGSHLLIATGRRPNLDGLDLAAAEIATDAAGALILDRRLRTTNRRVFAIGDASGTRHTANLATHQVGVVIRNALFRLPSAMHDQALARVTHTSPEIAEIGLSEAAARDRFGGGIVILRWPFFDTDRAHAERATGGLVKAVARKNGRILGAAILGAGAGELIQPWGLALAANLKLKAMTDTLPPYPTLGEASKRAAEGFYMSRLFNPRMRRLVRFLARFG